MFLNGKSCGKLYCPLLLRLGWHNINTTLPLSMTEMSSFSGNVKNSWPDLLKKSMTNSFPSATKA